MPQLDSYEVWIQVDGKKLPEYGMHYSRADQTEITCWIPSEVGKAFKICYKNSDRAFTTGARALVDGNLCPGRILHSRQARPFQPDTTELNGVPVSNNSYRPFVFSNCQLTDDDEFVPSSADPGQITILVKRLAVGAYDDANMICNHNPFPQLKIHERSKKALVHGIQQTSELNYETFHLCLLIGCGGSDWDQNVLIKREYGKRRLQLFNSSLHSSLSIDHVLKADGIVPPSTPSDNEVTLDRNAEEARIRALKEELRALEARQRQKKRKRSNSNLNTSVQRFKRERSFTLDTNVIDLT